MISVCIPTYNGARFIRQQLDSIICQLNDEDEIIISDDSSKDNTLEVINRLHDSRIRVYKGNYHSPIFNLENALSKAKGDVIFLADQDDIWLPNKVEVIIKYLKQYDCVVSDAIVVDEKENVLLDSFMAYHGSKPGFINNLIKNSYLGCCMAFNRKIMQLSLPFPKTIPMHDIWIGAIADCFGKPVFINDRLVKYRRHSNTVTNPEKKSKYSLLKKAVFRYNILVNILKRMADKQ